MGKGNLSAGRGLRAGILMQKAEPMSDGCAAAEHQDGIGAKGDLSEGRKKKW
jgi:hypothetical protein